MVEDIKKLCDCFSESFSTVNYKFGTSIILSPYINNNNNEMMSKCDLLHCGWYFGLVSFQSLFLS